jgi:hypothetical protein
MRKLYEDPDPTADDWKFIGMGVLVLAFIAACAWYLARLLGHLWG